MSIDKGLLTRFIREYPFQPATAFWRAIEIGHVVSQPFPHGFGLDLGCGDGKLTKIILEKTGRRELVGIDVDPQEVGQAELTGIYKRLQVCPASQIPENGGVFDFVFSNSVLEHIDNIEDVIREVARLLKTGGVFLFTVPGNDFSLCLKGPLLPFISRELYIKKLNVRLANKWLWSAQEWGGLLSRHGLRIETATDYLHQQEVRRWETISRFTAGVLYTLLGEKKSPIEIQRTFGMRKAAQKTPLGIARFMSALLLLGLKDAALERAALYGGLMINARKI